MLIKNIENQLSISNTIYEESVVSGRLYNSIDF